MSDILFLVFLPSGGRNGLVYREASRGWNRLQEEAEAEEEAEDLLKGRGYAE
jgi:hypothetical protein